MKKLILAAMGAMAVLLSANAQCPGCPAPAPAAPCCADTVAAAPCCKEGKVEAPCCKVEKPEAPCCKEGSKPACTEKAKVKGKKQCCKEAACEEINPCEAPAPVKEGCRKPVQVMKVQCPSDTVTVLSTDTLTPKQ